MRFFSNEAQDNVDEKTDRPTDTVPQQRAGSPWQNDTDPEPTAVGTSAVGTSTAGDADTVRPDDDPDRTDRLPDSADRTVAFSDGVTRDKDGVATGDKDGVTSGDKAQDGFLPSDKDQHKDQYKDKDKDNDNDGVDDTAEVKEGFKDGDGDRDEFAAPKHSLPEDTKPHHELPTDTTPVTVEPDEDPVVDTEPVTEPVVEPVAATTASGPLPFFPAADTQPLRDRWREVQLRFVDDPKGATGEASSLVDEAVDKLSTALREHRGSFSKGTDDTEALRVELRSYRDILDRLLGL
ncbi:hypothetical protein [Actinoplanes subglobosus]|uniref:Uncharacterized protein n=1 Tax=Actinoplanes subglobosus TaxID=1547892 RepID=A0ABV8JCE1_9ACTN